MAAGAWTFTNNTRTNLSTGTYLDADTYKIALFQSTSNIGAASDTYAALTNEVANGSGYTTGGAATTVSRSGTTTVLFDATDVSWTASGGNIVARFAVLYEVAGKVIAYCLLVSPAADFTLVDGNTLTLQNGASVMSLA